MKLTYCTNVHPGESWSDVRAHLGSTARALKARRAPDRPFPLGLRLSARAAREIDADERARFRDWCATEGFRVPTLNGFPHGRFHGPGVKEKVYWPDWRDPERLDYTLALAAHLEAWLPPGGHGTVSTVPVAFRSGFRPDDWPRVLAALRRAAEGLAALAQTRGVVVQLCLEPEPCCVVETSDQAIELFERLDLSQELAPHLGLCFDACHQAVEFEEPLEAWERLARAGVSVGKVQVSSALSATPGEWGALAAFDEPAYLHQVVARDGEGGLARFEDLPAFLALESEARARFEEARVHFHVPIFAARAQGCGTTRGFLEQLLPRVPRETWLEVETYTWEALPPALRAPSLVDSLDRELAWAEAACRAASEATP